MTHRPRPTLRRIATLLLVIAATIPWSQPAHAQNDTFPETAREAFELYEREYPTDKWLDGPVQYMLLDYERDLWKDIDDDDLEGRQDFIAWFWGRRDPDPRDNEHQLMEEFYTRVAYANQRFSGFPKGWRSDRGRVYITLGPPTGGMRRTRLDNFGRCTAREGEWWTYYTNNMSFSAQFGEFNVIFAETRVGTFELCDPVMLGIGGMPVELSRALDMTRKDWVFDDATEFGAEAGEASVEDVVTYFENTEVLDVPADGWGAMGIAGSIVVPVSVPFRKLLFEAEGEQLVANLRVEASTVAVGQGQGAQGAQQWRVAVDSSMANAIAGASLQTAIVLPADPGGYSVTVQIVDPLSGTAWRWEGPVEVAAEGNDVSPPLLGSKLLQLRESGEIAVVGPTEPTVSAGERFALVSWVRGVEPVADDVTVQLVTADGVATDLEVVAAMWGNQAFAGPLVIESVASVPPGEYLLRLRIGTDELGVERRVTVR